MEKIDLKVSTAYALYKQAPYILIIILALSLLFFFSQHNIAQYDIFRHNIFRFNIARYNIPHYDIILLSVAGVLLLRAVYGFMYFKLIRIEVFPDRLSIRKGVFTYAKDFLELYRVKDYEVRQNLFMRLFGMMSITLHTSDKTSPVLNLVGIPKSNIVEMIRDYVEAQRALKGVREFD